MTNSKKTEEFENNDEVFYFKNEVKKTNPIMYIILAILLAMSVYVLKVNWTNLNQYNEIRSEEKYPVGKIFKDQIGYFGNDYELFKKNSGVNNILSKDEIQKYWNNCIGSCEIPGSNRFKVINEKQEFINWVCNERAKEEKYSGTKYAIWKLNVDGCILTNLDEIKEKDKEEIKSLKWEKQKEMEIYIAIFLVLFLGILNILRNIMKKK